MEKCLAPTSVPRHSVPDPGLRAMDILVLYALWPLLVREDFFSPKRKFSLSYHGRLARPVPISSDSHQGSFSPSYTSPRDAAGGSKRMLG